MYRIAEGGRIPEHTHGGSEMTLVLRGGFADESGEYHPGDFLVREGWDKHTPVALEGEECICLAVLDAPLRFTRLRHRWLNPLLKLRGLIFHRLVSSGAVGLLLPSDRLNNQPTGNPIYRDRGDPKNQANFTMQLVIPRETQPGENRVSRLPRR